MGRLVIMFLQILLIALSSTQIIDCGWPGESSWYIEWTFVDSSITVYNFSYLIEVDTERNKYDEVRTGYIDSITGVLFKGFSTVDRQLFLETNPILRMKLFDIDSITVYDSLFTWEQMDFKKQSSAVENCRYENLSKKTIYLDSITSNSNTF